MRHKLSLLLKFVFNITSDYIQKKKIKKKQLKISNRKIRHT